MSPEDVKAVRKELGCTARDLAAALDVTAETVLAWEKGELFPTKRYVDALRELQKKGPSAFPKRSKKAKTPIELLEDPDVWRILRKLVTNETFRNEVLRLEKQHD